MAKTIYIVEDDEMMIDIFEDVLKADIYGLFDVYYFRSHESCIREIQLKMDADLVLWDFNVNGKTIFDAFIDHKFRCHGNVTIFSGRWFDEETDLMMNRCFLNRPDFFEKPFSSDAIIPWLMQKLYPDLVYLYNQERLTLCS